MVRTCETKNCDNPPFDACDNCGKQVCERHGKKVGDRFVCRACIEQAR